MAKLRCLATLAVWGVLFAPGHAPALGTRDSAALAAMQSHAGGRTGLVVWESPRTGPWRIFACGLDGSNLRQLSPDVSGQDHIAASISPDGARVVYYQTKTLDEPGFYADHVGSMMMVDASATKGPATLLVPEVRTYFEHRFVRWVDYNTIAYIGKDHATYLYSLTDKKSTKLFDYPFAQWGAIPNRQLTHAIDGKNRVFKLQGGQAVQKQAYDGCQGNLSYDGLWAYRVRAGPHDFMRMRLGSWINEVFLPNHDSALPAAQNYIYFPQISRCQRYMALGASANKQNHFTEDYDVFVIPIDPITFKKTGDAVKYSFDTAPDIFPDVWVAPDPRIVVTTTNHVILPNEGVRVKAELRDQDEAPLAAVVSWSVSGGGALAPMSSGSAASQTETVFQSDGTAGVFTVTASAGGLTGSAAVEVVDPGAFPLRINCGSNDHDVSGWTRDDAFVTGGGDMTFDNPVDTSGVTGAAPAGVYRSVRNITPHHYYLPVPDGKYRLRLHFADGYDEVRSMSYWVEGVRVLSDFDVVASAGGVDRAHVEQLEVTVSDGDGLQISATASTHMGDVFEAGLELEVVSFAHALPDGGADPDSAVPLVRDGGSGPVDSGVDSPVGGGGCGMGQLRPIPAVAFLLVLGLGLACWRRRR